MDKYENLGVIGEGSYGVVMKCRIKNSQQLVAVKKFLLKMDDEQVCKVATREIKILKALKHVNLVNLIEVFRRKGYLYLIMEYVDHTLLDDLQKHPSGLPPDKCRQFIWQIFRGLEFCHLKNIIHRDIKPENVLVSQSGVVKLCDFGFARAVALGEPCTDYVSTRWYRAPELLVGDLRYGKEVDIWAVGCLFSEIVTGSALFPGDSDIDQLFCIKRTMGDLIPKHNELLANNALFNNLNSSVLLLVQPLSKKFSSWPKLTLNFLQSCLKMDPLLRPSSSVLLHHKYFTWDEFPTTFLPIFQSKLKKDGSTVSCTPQELIDLKSCPSSHSKKFNSNLPDLTIASINKSGIGTSASNNLQDYNLPPCVPLNTKPIANSQISSKTIESSDGGSKIILPKSSNQNTIMPPISNNNGTRRLLLEKERKSSKSLRPKTVLPKEITSEANLLGRKPNRVADKNILRKKKPDLGANIF